jgi:hypothetical protein
MNDIAERMVLGTLVDEEDQEENLRLAWLGYQEIKRLIGGVIRCRLYKQAG